MQQWATVPERLSMDKKHEKALYCAVHSSATKVNIFALC